MKKNKLMKLIVAALFVALTAVATMIIKIPTPTNGYIHVGDAMVLLSGVLLGPGVGAIAAGLGSAMADGLSGYMAWAPGTFLIKAATAAVAGLIYRKVAKDGKKLVPLAISGVAAEIVMVVGYFFYGALLLVLSGSGWGAAFTQEVLSLVPNLVQGACGVVIAGALLPLLTRAMDAIAEKNLRKNNQI